MKLITFAIAIQMLFNGVDALAQAQPGGFGGRGQQAPKSEPAQRVDTQIRIFALQNADANDIARIVAQLARGVRIVPDERTNSLIVSTTEAELEQIEGLIASLDQPIKSDGSSGRNIATIQMQHRDAEEVAERIAQMAPDSLFGGPKARVAADSARNIILINGSDQFVQRAREIVAELDTPAGAVQLDFAFFRADLNDSSPSPSVPSDLAAVAKELARYGRVELVGRLSTRAVEGEEFSIQGSIGQEMQAGLRGRLTKAARDGGVRLQISSSLSIRREKPLGDQGGRTRTESSEFSLETSLVTQRGDTVVIGTAPTGWKTGESAILVVQVRP